MEVNNWLSERILLSMTEKDISKNRHFVLDIYFKYRAEFELLGNSKADATIKALQSSLRIVNRYGWMMFGSIPITSVLGMAEYIEQHCKVHLAHYV